MRSLGGKLIIVTALTLLFCMLLFTILSWSLLKFYSEHDAKSDAFKSLPLLKREYQFNSTLLIRELEAQGSKSNVISAVVSPHSQLTRNRLQGLLAIVFSSYHLSTLAIISMNHDSIAQLSSTGSTSQNVDPELFPLIDQALQGREASSLQQLLLADITTSATKEQWVLGIAVPIRNTHGMPAGAFLALQPVDNYYAQELTQNIGGNVVLCLSGQVVGTTIREFTDQLMLKSKLCTLNIPNIVGSTQHYLTLAEVATAEHQIASSPSLVVVDVEPLYNLNAHGQQLLLLVIGMAIFIFGLGVVVFIFITRIFFIRPLRRLQARVRTLVVSNTDVGEPQLTTDELSMLSRSFSLLSESLQSESQALTEQMGNLLIMSDALISTLNVEHLLGEIVSRLGRIMQVKHVALLLYGREMLSPWAVAQWEQPGTAPTLPPTSPFSSHSPASRGDVVVHADPDGDITLAVTTKMAAISIPTDVGNESSGKRSSVRAKTMQSPVPFGLRRPRIPRPALRDLDMILARMVIQRKKIACGEDVVAIHQERNESWSRMALEAGYRSVIAVPLLLQDQAIGAFILYAERPHQVSSQDTFLLSTAAIQASMAIQNALLFAEVKEKNVALERADQLKSQFLANVTHELRTPLHSIISYGALLVEGFVDGGLTKEQEEHIQFMVNRAEDLSRLVDDMLDLSKIEADRIEVKIEPVELTSCLTEVVNQLRPLANKKELHLTLKVEEALPLVLADSHRLRQVAINLVSNAIKFTEKGGVTISCSRMRDGSQVHIAVQDTGIGISPAALGYIFEAFRQADGSTTRRFGGTGLGLTIAKKLIELQGGEVAVESVIGQGSTFSCTLPAASLSQAVLSDLDKR
jgi:signal transduction histidine kinase